MASPAFTVPIPATEATPRAAAVPLTTLLLVGAAALTLAAEPAVWLIQTWYQPGYEGVGVWAFLLATALAARSVASPLASGTPRARPVRLPLVLLALSAAVRLAAQLLDVNVIGAFVLVVDVFALAVLARLNERRHRIAPFWLAALFSFCLPVEPILQRVVGFALQQVSADVACGLLSIGFDGLACDGVRIRLAGRDVLVDLPCSGSRLLSLAGLIFALLNCARPARPAWAVVGIGVTLASVWLANGVRIAVLAVGIAFAPDLPFDVMAPVPHAMIGALVIAPVVGAMLVWRSARPPLPRPQLMSRRSGSRARLLTGLRGRAFALALLGAAVTITSATPRPVDASVPLPPPHAPFYLAGFRAQAVPLSEREHAYFQRYGGSASKARYGAHVLLLVSTTSPLRHLHDPAVCLGGAGYDVALLGTDYTGAPTAVYSARAPADDGGAGFDVRVSFVADTGAVAASVSEVVWHWIRDPGRRWTMVQRVSPATRPAPGGAGWEAAVQSAFNLT